MGLKFSLISDRDKDLVEEYAFICPACSTIHVIRVLGQEPKCMWNNNPYSPTCKPSVFFKDFNNNMCHFIIEDGNIYYLNDCTHEMRGEKVEIPNWGSSDYILE